MPGLTIPTTCGAILLPQTVLFPHGALPLHIFEPRYREMIESALDSDRLICVGYLKSEEASPLSDCVDKTGTIALIRAARLLKNGNYTLLLHGILRVKFQKWLNTDLFPRAKIEPALDTTLDEAAEKEARAALTNIIHRALAPFPEEVLAQFDNIMTQAENAAAMCDALAQQLVHDPEIRQKLLSISDTKKRVAFLIRFLKNTSDLN